MTDYLMLPLAVLPFPDIDPVIVQIGPLAIHWYGLGYVVGILFAWWYAKRLVANPRLWPAGVKPMRPEDIDDFLVWAAIGVVLGGRVGYILFYDLARYLANPLDIFAVWQGGMSFHGGFAGVDARHDPVRPLARHRHLDACSTSSRPACRSGSASSASPTSSIPSFGAGRPTFPGPSSSRTAGRYPRHPSQLYEAALEGLVLFLVLRLLTHGFLKLKNPGSVSRRLPRRLWAVAHLRRILPRARPAARLPRRRLADHGHGAFRADGAFRPLGHLAGEVAGGAIRRGMNRLGEKIAGLIQAAGPISVADYMAVCLFDPDDGYYTTREPFGATGDFITAPEVSQMFGELVGVWLVEAWQATGKPAASDDGRDRPWTRHADEGHGPHHRPDRAGSCFRRSLRARSRQALV